MAPIKIIYPYNEILPKKTAHDVYIFHNCHSLADQGFAVELLCGSNSAPDSTLQTHFNVQNLNNLSIKRLPIIRKNNPLNLTWNRYFFHFCQSLIKKQNPQFVICSVLKQAKYHFNRKCTQTKYIYEIHQLNWYPNMAFDHKKIEEEKHILKQADLIVTTTNELKEILSHPPYSLHNQIAVIPLAVHSQKLPPSENSSLKIGYIGQLYNGQGLEILLTALSQVSDVSLDIFGGKEEEIKKLKLLANTLNINQNRINFLGYLSPKRLPEMIKHCHAFVAPFENRGRMPYVAHTKLLEYAEWGRPIIAPDLPIVKEHLKQGVLYFKPDDINSLVLCMEQLKNPPELQRLQNAIGDYSGNFSWTTRAKNYSNLLQVGF